MSKKKHSAKKRHSQSSMTAKKLAREEEIADYKDRDRKRLKPLARNILLSDLVLLAATMMLENTGVINEVVSSILTLVGVGLLMAALYIQFAGGGRSKKRTL